MSVRRILSRISFRRINLPFIVYAIKRQTMAANLFSPLIPNCYFHARCKRVSPYCVGTRVYYSLFPYRLCIESGKKGTFSDVY